MFEVADTLAQEIIARRMRLPPRHPTLEEAVNQIRSQWLAEAEADFERARRQREPSPALQEGDLF